jgi:hypothetical protein
VSFLSIPVGPQSIRVFCGSRLPSLTRENFFRELGDTFMPGTPFMVAPLGLSGYVAAVLDLEPQEGLPDEVALIIYASLDAYREARQNSLQGRMYTHSHAGVFNMALSRGQFPGPVSNPDILQGTERWSWYLFDTAVDWQYGTTRLIFLQGVPPQGQLQQELLAVTSANKELLLAAGVDQTVVVASQNYAAIWLHGPDTLSGDPESLGLLVKGTTATRDLLATPVRMKNGTEGVSITGAAAFSFRFVRDPRFFL